MERVTSVKASDLDSMESVDVSFSNQTVYVQCENESVKTSHASNEVQAQESCKLDAENSETTLQENLPATGNLCDEELGERHKERDRATLVGNQKSELVTNIERNSVINVSISWMNDETGKKSELKWSHENCTLCHSTFDEWKLHVKETHKTLVDAVKETEGVNKLSSFEGDGSKTGTSGVRICSELSIPCLEGSKSIAQKLLRRRRRVGKSRMKISSEIVRSTKTKYNKRKPVTVKTEEAEAVRPIISPLPKKRKQSHPCKLEPAEYSSEESDDPDFEEDDPHSPEVSDDSDYAAPLVKTRARMLKQKKPTTDANEIASNRCGVESCAMIFFTIKERKRHEKAAHDGIRYKCGITECKEEFKTVKGRNEHEKAHQGIFDCDQCELIFTNRQDRAAHKKTHTSFKCGYQDCGKTYTTKTGMKRHRHLHTAERTFLCPVCAKTFVSKKNLDSHMNVHNDKNHCCSQCRKVFRNQKALDKHKRLHTGEGLLVCQFCGKKLNSKPSLERHERLHTGDKPYKCKFCDKRFVCLGSLQNHVQDHTGSQFVCARCGREFRSKNNLQEHERIHTGEKPVKCDICGEEFRKGSNLWSHKKRRHSTTRDYKCQVCNKAFFTPDSLRSHRVVHTGERNYECEYCHKGYANASARSSHIKQVHLGLKRKGNISKARRLKREGRMGETSRQLKRTDVSAGMGHSKVKTEFIGQKESHLDSQSQSLNSIPIHTGSRSAGLLQGMIPANIMIPDRRGAVQQVPHVPSGDPSQSDFYTMVDSIVQFSKEH